MSIGLDGCNQWKCEFGEVELNWDDLMCSDVGLALNGVQDNALKMTRWIEGLFYKLLQRFGKFQNKARTLLE